MAQRVYHKKYENFDSEKFMSAVKQARMDQIHLIETIGITPQSKYVKLLADALGLRLEDFWKDGVIPASSDKNIMVEYAIKGKVIVQLDDGKRGADDVDSEQILDTLEDRFESEMRIFERKCPECHIEVYNYYDME